VGIDLRSALTKIRSFLAALAPVTPIKLDDAFVVLIDAALFDASIFGWLETKAQQPDGTLSLEGEPPTALRLALEMRGLNWGIVLASLPTLIQLIRDMQR
jgi:hypothetical protein